MNPVASDLQGRILEAIFQTRCVHQTNARLSRWESFPHCLIKGVLPAGNCNGASPIVWHQRELDDYEFHHHSSLLHTLVYFSAIPRYKGRHIKYEFRHHSRLLHILVYFSAIPRHEGRHIKLPLAPRVIHVADFTKHRPLRPALIVNSANRPHTTCGK